MSFVSLTPTPSYNIVLLGNSGVGKTSFLRALKREKFEPIYLDTKGVSICPIEIDGKILNMVDVAGQERYTIEETIKHALKGATPSLNIIMSDVTSRTSQATATGFWADMARRLGGPVMHVYNKIDIGNKYCSSSTHISCRKNEIGDFITEMLEKIDC